MERFVGTDWTKVVGFTAIGLCLVGAAAIIIRDIVDEHECRKKGGDIVSLHKCYKKIEVK